MIKVLLLDDERLALEYLETIVDWRANGFEIIGVQTDARQALKQFKRERPELIVSDIRMVGMDGVDFAAAVRAVDQHTHILFLSGYKNFDYVQRAIRLGIDDYLLKSDINGEIFLKKLVEIRSRIERERQKTRYTEAAVFRELFEKGVEEKAYRDMMSEQEYIRLHRRYFFMICSVKHCPPFVGEYLPGVDKQWYIDAAAVGAEAARLAAAAGMDAVASFRLDEKRLLVILESRPGQVSERDAFEDFYTTVRSLFDALNSDSGRLRYDLFYARDRFTVREFGRVFDRGRSQLDAPFAYPAPRIYEFRAEPRRAGTSDAGEAYSEDRLTRALEQGDRAFLEDYMEALRIAIEGEDAPDYLCLLKAALTALARVERDDAIGVNFNLGESADSCDFFNPTEVARFIERKLSEARQLYLRGTRKAYSKSIQTAVEYIRENLGVEDLSASMVARKVNLSLPWLSAKFKEEVGVGITEFLNNMRIQRARELLSGGDYMIYEVSEQCGFASSQYFSRMFKQITGMTPNEYRRKNKRPSQE